MSYLEPDDEGSTRPVYSQESSPSRPVSGSIRTIHVESAAASSVLPPLNVRPVPDITPITPLRPVKALGGKAVPSISARVTFGSFPPSPPSSCPASPVSTSVTDDRSPSALLSGVRDLQAMKASQGSVCYEEKASLESQENKMQKWRQVVVALVAGLAHVMLGAVIAYPAIALPQLTSPLEGGIPSIESRATNKEINYSGGSRDNSSVERSFPPLLKHKQTYVSLENEFDLKNYQNFPNDDDKNLLEKFMSNHSYGLINDTEDLTPQIKKMMREENLLNIITRNRDVNNSNRDVNNSNRDVNNSKVDETSIEDREEVSTDFVDKIKKEFFEKIHLKLEKMMSPSYIERIEEVNASWTGFSSHLEEDAEVFNFSRGSVLERNQEEKFFSFMPFKLPPHVIGLFGGIHTGGAVPGCLFSGPLMSMAGQRRAILMVTPVVMVSWLLVATTSSTVVLLSARFFAGTAIGVAGTSAQMYIIETSHSSIRGTLTGISDLLVGIGILFVLSLGASGIGWRGSAIILGVITCLPLLIGLSLCPDSPRWLVTQGRDDHAADALRILRGSDYDIDYELKSIQEANEKVAQNTSTFQQLSLLKNSSVRKPFLLVCAIYALNQFSGNYIIYSYTISIFKAAGVGLKPVLSAMCVGLARVFGSCIGMIIVEKVGRRISLLMGSTGGAMMFALLGTWFWILERDMYTAKVLSWLPLSSLVAFTIILAATTSPIPFLLAGELLPLSFRSLGSSLSKGVFFLVNLVVTLTFPALVDALGKGPPFWLYSCSAMLLSGLVLVAVPETKGKTLEEIEQFFSE